MTRFVTSHKLTRWGKPIANRAIVSTLMLIVSMVILPSCMKAHLAPNQGKPAVNPTDSLQLSKQSFINHPRPESHLQWHTCDNGVSHSSCSILEVPLDYKNPALGTIRVGISRIKARKAHERIGTLFVNPGGPGGPGDSGIMMISMFGSDDNGNNKSMPQDFSQLMDHFDIIGFDPRGVTRGRGDSIQCPLSLIPHPNIPYPPLTVTQFNQQKQYNHNFSLACRSRIGALMDHIDTRSVVDDIDSIRKALGETTISFYGASYGTEIGQLYAEKYPQQLRAIVLDSNIDHALEILPDPMLWEGKSNEEALQYLDQRCKNDPSCSIPGKNITSHLANLEAQAQLGHLVSPDGTPITARLISLYIKDYFLNRASLVGSYDFNILSKLFAKDPDILKTVSGVQNYFEDSFGHIVVCHDFYHPVINFAQYSRWLQQLKNVEPNMYLANDMLEVQTACMNWSIPQLNPPAPLHISPQLGVLIMANHIDPATPWENSQALHQAIPNSRLITTSGVGHGSLLTHCGRVIITQYLLTAKLPPSDEQCSDSAHIVHS